ncbi:hypothetical protein ATEIFO6365_0009010800 [Aspergillus terreus]|uniref:Uncharacterized protein n=1 Tax=Aspergillus terreus TaxID=33178 RepID=A0A5M3Z7H5_ASPTE|nr:hypothetical protein ATETN484_0011010800 [Aspergillus terreus]GFF18745.1 hypothetical protein ATEIFO6365_0009010800 [Aspergillus terreus]
MSYKETAQYSPLDPGEKDVESSKSLLSSDGSSVHEGEARDYGRHRTNRTTWLRAAGIAMLGITGMLLSFFLGRNLRPSWNEQCIDTQWGDLKQNVRFIPQTFNPRFEGPKSPYMGEPNPDVDQLWYGLSKMFNYGVDYDTLKRMNRTKAAAQWPGTKKYQVGLETFHQLHCLNYVRMYTYQSYYEKIDYDMVAETPEERQEHKDHCVEVLRQSLMCSPDLNIYSYHWIGHRKFPYAELHTPHQKCIDWDAFYSWQRAQAVASPALEKPDGAEILFE